VNFALSFSISTLFLSPLTLSIRELDLKLVALAILGLDTSTLSLLLSPLTLCGRELDLTLVGLAVPGVAAL